MIRPYASETVFPMKLKYLGHLCQDDPQSPGIWDVLTPLKGFNGPTTLSRDSILQILKGAGR